MAEIYENIGKIKLPGNHAEKKLRGFYAERVSWSLEITASHWLIEFWTVVAKGYRKCKVNARTIIRKKKVVGYNG